METHLSGYQIERTEHGDIRGCSICGVETAIQEFSDDRSSRKLCVFCANMTGKESAPLDRVNFARGLNVLAGLLSKSHQDSSK